MMRALLMAMPDIYQSWDPTLIVGPWVGGVSIAGNCREHEVYVADLILKRDNVKGGIREAIEKTNPQIVGLNAMTFQFPSAVRVAGYIKKEYGLPIALGGYHATAMREEIANSDEEKVFDYIFAGEAEHTFKEFLEGVNPGNISGLSYRLNGKWVHNPRHCAIGVKPGLDSILPPKRDTRIWKGFHFYDFQLDTAETSRGCDYSCDFCSMRKMQLGAKFNQYPLERVIEDIKSVRSLGAKSIFFTDDNPAMHPNKFRELLNEIVRNRLNDMRYSGMVSTAGMSNKEMTRLMKEAGFDFVFLGVENVYSRNLSALGTRKTNADLTARAIENLHESGIVNLPGIIAGSPDDDEETIRANFRWFHNHPVDGLMCQFLTPYPGTALRDKLLKEGLVVNPGGMENKYGGWSTYNGEFAQCKTRTGLMPGQIEAIVYDEQNKFGRIRAQRFLRGELNFPKLHPGFMAKWILRKTLPNILTGIKQRGLTMDEKARADRQRKLEMNQFDI